MNADDEFERLSKLLDVGLVAVIRGDGDGAEMALAAALETAQRLPKKPEVICLPTYRERIVLMADTQTANPVGEQQAAVAQGTGAALAVVQTPKPPIKAEEGEMAIRPKDLDEAWRYAEMIWKSGTAPESYDSDPKKIIIGVLASLELGVAPMTGLRNIAIINKRPAIWGDLAIALCQKVIKSFEHTYTGNEGEDDYACRVTIWRKGQDAPYTGSFSVRDAKRAGLWMNARKQPWVMYPNRMLFNRARAFALRDGFADCLAGLAIAEEVQDLPTEPKVLESGVLDDTVEVVPTPPAPDAKPEAAE